MWLTKLSADLILLIMNRQSHALVSFFGVVGGVLSSSFVDVGVREKPRTGADPIRIIGRLKDVYVFLLINFCLLQFRALCFKSSLIRKTIEHRVRGRKIPEERERERNRLHKTGNDSLIRKAKQHKSMCRSSSRYWSKRHKKKMLIWGKRKNKIGTYH